MKGGEAAGGGGLPRRVVMHLFPLESGRAAGELASNQSQSAISQAVKSVCGCSRLRPCRAECNGMRADT